MPSEASHCSVRNMTGCSVTQCDMMQCHRTTSIDSHFYIRKLLSEWIDLHGRHSWPAVDVHCHGLSHLACTRIKSYRNKLGHTNILKQCDTQFSWIWPPCFSCSCIVIIKKGTGRLLCNSTSSIYLRCSSSGKSSIVLVLSFCSARSVCSELWNHYNWV